jgi:hypothetical protein
MYNREIKVTILKAMTDEAIHRMKNLQEFIVEREWEHIPSGKIRYNIKHKQGEMAKIFVHAMTQQEAEDLVDGWFNEASDES